MSVGTVDWCIDCGETSEREGRLEWEPGYLDCSDTNERVCPKCWDEAWNRCECCGDAKPMGDLSGYHVGHISLPLNRHTIKWRCGDCEDCGHVNECQVLERRANSPWFHEVKPRITPITDDELSEVTAMIAESAQRIESRRSSETLRRSS